MTLADAVFVAAPLAILLLAARSGAERILAIGLVLSARVLLAIGAFQFVVPEQVGEMIAFAGDDPARLWGHEHWGVWWPRYLFTSPAILAAEATAVPLERTFPLFIAAVLPIEAFLVYRAAVGTAPVPGGVAIGVAIGAALFVVATRMNGRLVVAHAGMALIVAAQAAAIRAGTLSGWTWPALVLGTLMGHMTTGAGLVAYATAVGGTLAASALGARGRRAAWVFSGSLTLALAPLLFGDVWKNLTFFAFDPVALLGHGLGAELLARPVLWLAAGAIAVGAAIVAAWAMRARGRIGMAERAFGPAAVGVALSAAGGLFGYSTLSMGLPAGLAAAAGVAVAPIEWPKRMLDLAGAAAALVVLSPVLLACALAVRATSPGPAFYRATRIGKNERRFVQWKLRTMTVGAERGGFRTDAGDLRVTGIGRLLRAASLDELPQLWNVVRGEMSLVGPRPAAPEQLAEYTPAERAARAHVRPGITGLAQVSGRSALTPDRSLALDLEYAGRASLWLDLRILARTLPAVLSRRGTN